jgi:RNA polymerase sigma-70 factor (ECF subfamily)
MTRIAIDGAASLAPRDAATVAAERATATDAERVRAAVRAYHAMIWRSMRRLGVPEGSAEDAVQQVFGVFARRIDQVAPDKEKTFLFGVTIRVAQSMRREERKSFETSDEQVLASLPSTDATPEQLLDAQRARALLDALLDSLPPDLRTVFVLYEIEEMTMIEIASVLDLPAGTVASRLRRARETFDRLSRRAQAELARKAGGR